MLASISCRSDESLPTAISVTPESSSAPRSNSDETPAENVGDKVVESFSDEVHVARPGRNKVQIDILERGAASNVYKPNNLAIIKFYSRETTSNDWNLKQTLEINSEALMEADPQIEDFNNDGLKDITFISNTAARGANEVRTLLIYDKRTDALIHVKNSEDFPNLAYNRTLKCIDSWMFHGATTTVFLKLDGDMLKEFASVNTGTELVVDVIGKNGDRKEIRRQKMSVDDVYTRYETFAPPRPYSDENRANRYPRRF
jgi:hypothetical protein